MTSPEIREEQQKRWVEPGEIDPQRLRDALHEFAEAVRRDGQPPHLRPPFLLRLEDLERRID